MVHAGLLERALQQERLTYEQAAALWAEEELAPLGLVADALVRRRFPGGEVRYAVDRLIIYADRCAPGCEYCGGTGSGSLMTPAEAAQAAAQLAAAGGTRVLLQGGHDPSLPLSYYVELVAAVREAAPSLTVAGFSPSEIHHFARMARQPVAAVLVHLKAAGLDELLGGPHEAYARRAGEYAAQMARWWDLYAEATEAAAALGLAAAALLALGGGEAEEERLSHLLRLRSLQERTGGVLTGFTPWFLPGRGSAHAYVKFVALSRLVLDNVRHVGAAWLSQGAKVAQVALEAGASDLGGTLMAKTRDGAACFRMAPAEMERLIRDAGRVPRVV